MICYFECTQVHVATSRTDRNQAPLPVGQGKCAAAENFGGRRGVERDTEGGEWTLSCLGVAWLWSDEGSASGSVRELHPIDCANSYEIIRVVIICVIDVECLLYYRPPCARWATRIAG